MTPISFDFSQKTDLILLAHVVRDLQSVAQPMGMDFFLMGAAARDLMLLHGYNIDTGRQTKDVDFSVMVSDWESFSVLRSGLIDSGAFLERTGAATHRLRHAKSGLPLDIVPFGAIERHDRTISWPPKHSTVFDCFGIREAFDASVAVLLPEDVTLQVASIPALALLKVTAWQDRQLTAPGKDAADLLLYMRHYLDCGNLDRATTSHKDLFEADDFDYPIASAQLLGRDIALLLDENSLQYVLKILLPQTDANEQLLLASQSGLDLEQARRLIEAVCDGLADDL